MSGASTPVRAHVGDVGFDLAAALADDKIVIIPGGRACIPTGLTLVPPSNMYFEVRPRSGLAWEYGIDVLAGIIDVNYTGEVMVVLVNHGDEDFVVNTGDRIAQAILRDVQGTFIKTLAECVLLEGNIDDVHDQKQLTVANDPITGKPKYRIIKLSDTFEYFECDQCGYGCCDNAKLNVPVDAPPTVERGAAGFGSTGVSLSSPVPPAVPAEDDAKNDDE